MSTAHDIREAVAPALVPLGLVVADVSVSPAGRRRVVRVLVDRDISALDPADTASTVVPLSLDEVADGTRAVSDALDGPGDSPESDVMGATPYVLEVSSPGVGRPLVTHEDFRRQVGRLVEVHRRGEGGTETGRLVEVTTDEVVLGIPASKKVPARTVRLALGEVERGVVQVEFTRRASEPGTDGDPRDDDEDDLADDEDLDEVEHHHDHEHDHSGDDADHDSHTLRDHEEN
ncbi:ribosome maturation factor RimP [Terracoccus luteus]|uniref:Ribosome maturation factor RimP n=1 Tax=Terracoccus luteus TaxID=53356 RepID=A0A495XUF9_9MICO|nr:ribosome maturation factor RimP [Terracoccus luteus]RKT77572.1 ribosome maturation factor RimP [Terracoccus luteus]